MYAKRQLCDGPMDESLDCPHRKIDDKMEKIGNFALQRVKNDHS